MQQFSDDEGGITAAVEIVNRENVWVRKGRDRSRFLLKSLQHLRIWNDFDRHFAAKSRVARTINLTHSARGNGSDNLVRPQAVAGGELHIRVGRILRSRLYTV